MDSDLFKTTRYVSIAGSFYLGLSPLFPFPFSHLPPTSTLHLQRSSLLPFHLRAIQHLTSCNLYTITDTMLKNFGLLILVACAALLATGLGVPVGTLRQLKVSKTPTLIKPQMTRQMLLVA